MERLHSYRFVLNDDKCTGGPSGSKQSLYESMRATGGATTLIENLPAQVKQQDGEIAHLQVCSNNYNNAVKLWLQLLISLDLALTVCNE